MENLMRQLLVESPLKGSVFPFVSYTPEAECSIESQCQQSKPQHSYIGLIAMAILSSSQRKMILSEVYEWIMTEYSYFRSRGAGWRNSIRHNLSLNDCFVKAGRAANGKGHYWAIHPACIRDFERGDFRRRRAQRKVRRHMGLSVDEDDSSDSDEMLDSSPFAFLASPPTLQSSILPENGNSRKNSRLTSFTIDAILKHC